MSNTNKNMNLCVNHIVSRIGLQKKKKKRRKKASVTARDQKQKKSRVFNNTVHNHLFIIFIEYLFDARASKDNVCFRNITE